MITYQKLITLLTENPSHLINVHLPDGSLIPAHYHLTDVGCVNRYFIDCGGHTREENYIQMQLWLGKDSHHRLTADTFLKILDHSQTVLNKLDKLAESEIHIEYKTDFVAQYPMEAIDVIDDKIVIKTALLTTQCLAALRHEKENSDDSCCNTMHNAKHSKCC